jgi:hypothetical protein
VPLKFGVPPEAIVGFGTGNSSTYEEAHEPAAWARANGVRSIIVPTEIFSARRVRFILNKQPSSIGVFQPWHPRSTALIIGGRKRSALGISKMHY